MPWMSDICSSYSALMTGGLLAPSAPSRQKPLPHNLMARWKLAGSVGLVVSVADLDGDPAAVTYLVALLPGPLADGAQVPIGPGLPTPSPSPPTSLSVAHASAVLDVRREELLELLQVLLVQVDLVLAALIPEPNRAAGL